MFDFLFMELVTILQILSSSEVVKWLLKCPFYNVGLLGKKMAGYYPDLHAQSAGACVHNTDDPFKFELGPTGAAVINSVRKIKLSHRMGFQTSSS